MSRLRQRLAARAPHSRFWTFVQTLYEWTRPPRQLKTTSLGKLVIAFAILIGVAAINTGNNLLYLVLGGVFGVIAASGVLSERVLKGVQVELRLPRVVVAQAPAGLSVRLRADDRVDSFLLEIQVLDREERPLGAAALRELLRGATREVTVRVRPEKRGRLEIAGIRVATRFPFQMYEKARIYKCNAALWVAPAPNDVSLPKPAGAGDPRETRRAQAADGDQFQGLRERQPSDSIARIHWKRSLWSDRHVVKVFAAAAEPRIHVEIEHQQSADAFERDLGNAVGILEAARQQQRAVLLNTGSDEIAVAIDGAGRSEALLALAQLQQHKAPTSQAAA